MLQRLRRMLIPVLVSLCGIAATFYFERKTRPVARDITEQKAIGFVQSTTGFHVRQRNDSVMWAPLQDGDAIYPNDKVRTGPQGELTLALPSIGKSLDLESDTAVALDTDVRTVYIKPTEGYFSVLPRKDSAAPVMLAGIVDVDGAPARVPDTAASYLKEVGSPLRLINMSTEGLSSYENVKWLEPAPEAELELNPDSPKNHRFAWDGDRPEWQIQIEWGSSRRRTPEKKIIESGDHSFETLFPIGKHFWRWSVVEKDSGKVLWSSPTARMTVRGLFPPSVVGPSGNAVIRHETPDLPIDLTWLKEDRFSQYAVEVASEDTFAKPLMALGELQAATTVFKPVKFGTYYWRLTGKETAGGRAVTSKAHSFKFLPKVIDKIQLGWVTPDGSQQTFIGNKPTLSLKWAAKPVGERTYRVRIKPADGELGRPIESVVKTLDTVISLERGGIFEASIEGINAEGDVVGVAGPIQVTVATQPLLKPPVISFEAVQASSNGQITLQWPQVDGAREYQIEVKAPDGKSYSQSSRRNSLELKRLLPGNYDFTVIAVDAHGRPSDRSPAGRFIVPEKSGLKAPKIRKVEVE